MKFISVKESSACKTSERVEQNMITQDCLLYDRFGRLLDEVSSGEPLFSLSYAGDEAVAHYELPDGWHLCVLGRRMVLAEFLLARPVYVRSSAYCADASHGTWTVSAKIAQDVLLRVISIVTDECYRSTPDRDREDQTMEGLKYDASQLCLEPGARLIDPHQYLCQSCWRYFDEEGMWRHLHFVGLVGRCPNEDELEKAGIYKDVIGSWYFAADTGDLDYLFNKEAM